MMMPSAWSFLFSLAAQLFYNAVLFPAVAQREEMVRWHRRLDRHEFEQTPRDSEGQGGLARCRPTEADRA